MNIKPRLIRAQRVSGCFSWYCGDGLRQADSVSGRLRVFNVFNSPFGRGDSPGGAFHKWKRATVPTYRTRLEQQA